MATYDNMVECNDGVLAESDGFQLGVQCDSGSILVEDFYVRGGERGGKFVRVGSGSRDLFGNLCKFVIRFLRRANLLVGCCKWCRLFAI